MRCILNRLCWAGLGLLASSPGLAHTLYQEYPHTHPHTGVYQNTSSHIPEAPPLVYDLNKHALLVQNLQYASYRPPAVLAPAKTKRIYRHANPVNSVAKQTTHYSWVISPHANFYGGVGLGKSEQYEFEQGRSTSGKLYGGVRMMDSNMGAEAGYIGLGSVDEEIMDGRNPGTLQSETDIFYLAATGYVPLAQDWDLLGKVGVAYWNQENVKEVNRINTIEESDDDGLSAMLGVGTQYRIAPNTSIRGEFEHIFNIGEGEQETDASLISVGVTFSSY